MMDENLTGIKPIEGVKKLARNMIIPIVVMSLLTPFALLITGIRNSSASNRVSLGFSEALREAGLLGVIAQDRAPRRCSGPSRFPSRLRV
ncbi:MAG: hypothetical protein U5N26_01645 [Candidatus Marinimicrobia bacterium]|nr:hypothetical protein [Candidatus Neomarinimicrobiota bacterium]